MHRSGPSPLQETRSARSVNCLENVTFSSQLAQLCGMIHVPFQLLLSCYGVLFILGWEREWSTINGDRGTGTVHVDEVRKQEALGPNYSRTVLTFVLVGSKLLIVLIGMPRLLVSLCNGGGRGLYLCSQG